MKIIESIRYVILLGFVQPLGCETLDVATELNQTWTNSITTKYCCSGIREPVSVYKKRPVSSDISHSSSQPHDIIFGFKNRELGQQGYCVERLASLKSVHRI